MPPRDAGDAQGRRGRAAWLAVALLLAFGSLAYLVSLAMHRTAAPGASPGDPASVDGVDAAVDAAASAPASASRDAAPARPAVTGTLVRSADPNDLARYVTPGQPAPAMGEVIARLHEAGVHGGLAAFPPPGTRPALIGLAVPEDFALPPGYVRHYQATDDGQRIEPILMFSPDYEFFDAQGHPIAIPANRVVPPGLAPPGLALRLIALPPPRPSPDPST